MSIAPSGSGAPIGWTPPGVEELQQLLPRYDIELILGQGGMGAVYRGRQKGLERMVAIKLLPVCLIEGDDEDNNAERFKLEARAMANLNHPAIVSVYDFGQTSEGDLYFIMEYIDGMDIEEYIHVNGGSVPTEASVAIVSHVLDALDYAHSSGIVHRDIKPANVLINRDGRIKIADFGLAKQFGADADELAANMGLTMTNMVIGTPDYIAPEALIIGANPDHRADLYAVGVMLYRMLTGKLPRGVFKMASDEVPGLDPCIDGVIVKSMAADPDERFQSAIEFRLHLDEVLTEPVVRIVPGQDTHAISPPVGRHFKFPETGVRPKHHAEAQGGRELSGSQSALVPVAVVVEEDTKSRRLMAAVVVTCVLIAGASYVLLWTPDDPSLADADGMPLNAGSAEAPDSPRILTDSPASLGGGSNGLVDGPRPVLNLVPKSTSVGDEVDQNGWPSGANFSSEGGFRAWSSEPNDSTLDLSRLHGVEDVKQVHVREGAWIVLRKNGETISSDGLGERQNIRRICPGYARWFGLISEDGTLEAFERSDSKAGILKVPEDLGSVADAFVSGPHRVALLGDGSIRLWGSAHDGVKQDRNPEWQESPAIPAGRRAIAISSSDSSLVAKLDDGSLMAWKDKGRVDLSEAFDIGKVGDFAVDRVSLFAVSVAGGPGIVCDLNNSSRPTRDFAKSGDAFEFVETCLGAMLIRSDKRVEVEAVWKSSTPGVEEVVNLIQGAEAGLISMNLKPSQPRVGRLLWYVAGPPSSGATDMTSVDAAGSPAVLDAGATSAVPVEPESAQATRTPDINELKARLTGYGNARRTEVMALVEAYRVTLGAEKEKAFASGSLTAVEQVELMLVQLESVGVSIEAALVVGASQMMPVAEILDTELSAAQTQQRETFFRRLAEIDQEMRGKLERSLQICEAELTRANRIDDALAVRSYRAALTALLSVPQGVPLIGE